MTDVLKNWGMIALTLIFVVLYVAALLGWLKPLSDITIVTRLEPIIFVLIGYFFGRFPAQQNEKTLKEEINRQTQKADAAQHAKEHALQVREILEEKVKNVKAVLTPVSKQDGGELKSRVTGPASRPDDTPEDDPLILAAITILDS
jgi:hypothetical protein